MNCLEIHSVFLKGVWQIVLDEDVAILGQFVQDLHSCFMLERKGQGLLISIDLQSLSQMTLKVMREAC